MASTSVAATRIDIPGVQLGDELGRGAHSVVYSGNRGGKNLAVKIALDSEAGGSDADRQRFLREATLLASLRHPAFAEIFEIGELSGRAYLVMERVDGVTLFERMADRPLTTERIAELGQDIAAGLAAIHRRGLVHRDVKPRNVVVGKDRRARLIDFGLVTRSGIITEGEIGGTFLYSAPEQTGLLKRPVDGRADLYALGVLLYECVAGKTPFRSDDPGELMRQHAVMEPPRLDEIAPAADPILAKIIHRLIAKDPDDRYQTAEGLASDLQRLSELNDALAGRREILLGRDDFAYGVLREAPLIGREPELRRLKKFWERCRRGRGCTVLVQGPPGVGKSRLLSELMSYVRGTGGLVIQAQGKPDRQAP
ncbi:MAG: serine/threonine-protein kinase, partial [Myxococcota bacterium]